MKASGRLTVRCADSGVARRLEEVLTPDNVGVPKDQRFSMSRRGESLIFGMESETLLPLLSTVSSILEDASLFQEVWLLSRGWETRVRRRP